MDQETQETEQDDIKKLAAVLRSTEPMADQFATRIQERVGDPPVSHAEILAVTKKMSPKQLSMDKVVGKLKQQRN
jgi:hypothetical protein